MNAGKEKYDKVLNVLRKSEPVLSDREDIENEVFKAIANQKHFNLVFSDLIDFLFGWTYISWVRRTLVTASVCLIMVFVWQQGIILRQINHLSQQTMNHENSLTPADLIEKRLTIYKLSGRKFGAQTVTIPQKEMNQLLDSINELQTRYKDLMDVIGKDPVLKIYIEKKLSEINHTKINL